MAQEILLKGGLIRPRRGQVLFLENNENKSLSSFIRKNHEWLKEIFKNEKLQFIYLPIWLDEVIKYNAPQVDSKKRKELVEKLAQEYCPEDVQSAILAYATATKDSGMQKFAYKDIETKWYSSKKTVFEHMAKEIRSEINMAIDRERESRRGMWAIAKETRGCEESSRPEAPKPGVPTPRSGEEKSYLEKPKSIVRRSIDPDIRFSRRVRKEIEQPEPDADELFEKESQKLADEILERVRALRGMGKSTTFLHGLIDKDEKLSRLVITKDKRILLPDYDNMEIHLSELPKAVFLLFLRHQEGIRFKELPDYRDELLKIYLSLNPRGSKEKNERSICDITDPLKNSINEKCARIREAFVKEFDDRLAKHYYIRGKQGEAKRIELDAELIEWE